jgi:Zn-dependent M28 family amino/carboxypeptidase
VAHLDSKSQTIPMLVRVGAVVLFALMKALLILSLIKGANEAARLASFLCVVALLPLVLCVTRNKSNGALDNASGVAAVLLAAPRLPESAGVLITSGEELGLAGARAFARSSKVRGVALNCDTIDDRGEFLVMRSGLSRRSAGALKRAADASGISLRLRHLIPGILADHVAFNQSGWDSCTLSKGNLATLRDVHTSGDRNTSIDGTAIAQAGDLLVTAAEELT